MADHVLSTPTARGSALAVRRIAAADVFAALRAGWDDFTSMSTHALFLVVLYPLIGLLVGFLSSDAALMPLFFPLAAGFAILGPVAALGIYELSRRRERGEAIGLAAAGAVLRSPALTAVLELALLLAVLFVGWLVAAVLVMRATLGEPETATVTGFLDQVLTTRGGWAMIVAGMAVGAAFAAASFAIGAVSFPLLLDRTVGAGTALATSIRAVRTNPGPMALWAAIIAGGLLLGSLPLFIGLAIVFPVLGHATWHLYRRLVP